MNSWQKPCVLALSAAGLCGVALWPSAGPDAKSGVGMNVEILPATVTVCRGDAVTFQFVTRMLGGFDGLQFRNVFVNSSLCSDLQFVGGDANGNGYLDFGEEFTNECTVAVEVSQTHFANDGADVYYLDQFAGTVRGQDSSEVIVLDCDDGCTYTLGYWKTHPESWPVSTVVIGGVSYTQKKAMHLLWRDPNGDASIILAHQWIAAYLNVANGASADAIAQTWAEADAWLATYGVGSRPRGAARDEAIRLAAALDAYNNGWVGPGHCDD